MNNIKQLAKELENLIWFSFVDEGGIKSLPSPNNEKTAYYKKIPVYSSAILSLFIKGKTSVIDRIRHGLEQKKSELQELQKQVEPCSNEILYNSMFDCPFVWEPDKFNILISIRLDFITELLDYINNLDNTPKSQQITIPDNILSDLQIHGFIENAAVIPLKWIKTNGTTHGQIPNKKSLLDLLCLLEYSDSIIKNRTMLNSLFIFPNNKPLSAQNYTDITDSKGNILRPIVSEYHSELENIINKSKEK